MNRLIFILSFCLLILFNTFGQTHSSSILEKKFDLNLLLIQENIVADSLIKVNGDSADIELKKVLAILSFINSIFRSNSYAHDQLICSMYNIPYIIKPLGWVSDYGHIFTEEQVEKLD